jgi:hypothetical protein
MAAGVFVANAHGFGTPALAQTEPVQNENSMRPVVQRLVLPASLLHAGATREEVASLLGPATSVTELDPPAHGNAVLLYANAPLRTRVVLTEGRVSEITLDPVYFDVAPLPARTRAVKARMIRGGVVSLLGSPDADHRWVEAGLTLEQMTFARPTEPEFSVYLANDLVVDMRLGHETPSGISSMSLPAPAPDDRDAKDLAIGQSPAQAAARLGPPVSVIHSALKGQSVVYAQYRGRDGGGLISVTFTGEVLTAFKIWPPDVS